MSDDERGRLPGDRLWSHRFRNHRLLDQPFAEQFVLWAIRAWVAGLKAGASRSFELQRGFEVAGIPHGLEALDGLLGTIATGATRSIDIRCTRCRRVSDDERAILAATAACQSGATSAARSVYGSMLVPAAARIAASKTAALSAALAEVELLLDQGAGSVSSNVHRLEPRARRQTVH